MATPTRPRVHSASNARSGLMAVVGLETRIKIRSTRWRTVFIVAFIALVALAVTVGRWAQGSIWSEDFGDTRAATSGPNVFAVGLLGAFIVAAILVPVFAGGAINGDRAAGVLAPVQLTRLTPMQIATGKLFSAWIAALATFALGLPVMIAGVVLGGVSWWAVPAAWGAGAVLLGVFAAVCLAVSGLVAHLPASLALSYLGLLALCTLPTIAFALAVNIVGRTEPAEVYGISEEGWERFYEENSVDGTWEGLPLDSTGNPIQPNAEYCEWYPETVYRSHSELVWWLMAANPFAVLADATPAPIGEAAYASGYPLADLGASTRNARTPGDLDLDWCWPNDMGPQVMAPRQGPAVWPVGLAIDLVFGIAGWAIAMRCLALPYRRLPRGIRVA